jgi:stearoyl-CoA desaturase (delta-9 desaturase)
MEALLIVLFGMADQGSIQGWTLTHAMHHCASDTSLDPHNRKAGFWHSHFGWMYSVQQFHLPKSEYHRVMSGLGPIPRFHDKVCHLWDPCWSHVFPAVVASFWGEAWHGFFVAGALRWMCVQHITFFVNSVAHGPREGESDVYNFNAGANDIGPRVSLIVSFLALGEGWHDYHHMFPWDYAAAELDWYDQWNPTKMFIDFCGAFGMVWDRRRSSEQLQMMQRSKLLSQAGLPPVAEYKVEGPVFLRCRVPARTKGQADGKAWNGDAHASMPFAKGVEPFPEDTKGVEVKQH